MHVVGYKYPLSGLPKKEIVNGSALVKRAIMANIRFIVRLPKMFTPRRMLYGILEWMCDLYRGDYGGLIRILPEDTSRPIRELVRTLRVINPHPTDEWVSLISCIFEIDLAYRRRLQDVLEELNKVKLLHHPRHEVFRLIDIVIARENVKIADRWQREKVQQFRTLMRIAWLFKPFRDLIIAFLKEVNVDAIKRDIADWYWVCDLFDYNYGGKSFDERQAWKEKENEGWVQDKPTLPLTIDGEEPKIEINPPNKAFYKLKEEGAQQLCAQVHAALMVNWKENQIQ